MRSLAAHTGDMHISDKTALESYSSRGTLGTLQSPTAVVISPATQLAWWAERASGGAGEEEQKKHSDLGHSGSPKSGR